MSDKFVKNINLQNVIDKEDETHKRSIKNLDKPLKLLDETTSFLVTTIRIALELYKNSQVKLEKDFLTVYLNIANAALHITRSSKINLVNGYYGSVMVLNRALQNYLHTLMYVHHEPKDCDVLIKEEKHTYKSDKSYRSKFHERSLRTYLKQKGYSIEEDALDTFAKVTHGSTFSAQIYGYKPLRDADENAYDVLYAPEYDVTKAIHLIQLLIVSPLDFSRFFIMHFNDKTKKWKRLETKLKELDRKSDIAIQAMDKQFNFFKNAPEDVVERFFESKKENAG
jgi:hypothetical protein